MIMVAMKSHSPGGLVRTLACVLAASCDTTVQRPTLQWTPSHVEVTGVLKLETHYGPPGYGETPSRDEKDTVPILVLSSPIGIEQDTLYDQDLVAMDQVSEIQLAMAMAEHKYLPMANRTLVVRGKLLPASNAHHVRDVVMLVDTLTERTASTKTLFSSSTQALDSTEAVRLAIVAISRNKPRSDRFALRVLTFSRDTSGFLIALVPVAAIQVQRGGGKVWLTPQGKVKQVLLGQ